MEILAILYGQFPEVLKLYSRFQPGVAQIKMVIDIEPSGGFERAKFLKVFGELSEFFPTITQHSCCEEWQSLPLYLEEESGVSVKRVGECADVAHLIEHVIVDMQVRIGGMSKCSGLTCGWKKPDNRFDLFIECTNARIGLFAAQYAVHLVSTILNKSGLSPRHRYVLELAEHLITDPGTRIDVDELAERLGWSRRNTMMALETLERFGFFFSGEESGRDGEENRA